MVEQERQAYKLKASDSRVLQEQALERQLNAAAFLPRTKEHTDAPTRSPTRSGERRRSGPQADSEGDEGPERPSASPEFCQSTEEPTGAARVARRRWRSITPAELQYHVADAECALARQRILSGDAMSVHVCAIG